MCGKWRLKGSSLGTALAVLFFVFVAFSPFRVYAVDTQGETNIVVSSSPPGSAVRFIQGVGDGLLSLEKDVTFKVKAFVEPVTVTEESIYAQRELNIPGKEFVCRESPCRKTWDFDFSDQPVSVSEFPRLQIAWGQVIFGATPMISVEALITPDGDSDDIRLIGHFNRKDEAVLHPVKTIDMKAADYVEKSTWYLAKRELGFEEDERWRYDQNRENLVLQARVDLPLKEVQAVQVFFDPKKIPKLEGIQLSVDTNGNGRRDIFILFGQTKHDLKRRGGRTILTLDLRGAIKNLSIDPEKAILQEPVIFLPTNFSSYKRDLPIHEIVFARVDQKKDAEVIKPKVWQRGKQYSLGFDFSQALERLSIWDAKLGNLKIMVDLDGPQVITWDRVRLFDMWETQVPILSNEPGKAFRDWGKNSEGVQGALLGFAEGIKAFRPFWMQSFKEASPAYKDPTGNNAFLFLSRERKVTGKEAKSMEENRSGRRVYLTDDNVERALWSSEDNMVRGSVYYWVSGAMDNSVIQGEITIEHHLKTKTAPVYLLPGFNSLTPRVQNGARIKNFKIKPPIYMDQGRLNFDVVLFDVQTREPGTVSDYKDTRWWKKGAEIPLSVNGKTYTRNEKRQRILFFPGEMGENTLSFLLPDQEFALPLEFILPGQLPQPCVATLKINDRNTVIPYGPYTLPLLSFSPISGEIEFTIEYLGKRQIIEMPIPRIKVMGLRHTPEDELKKIGVLIDNKSVGLRVANIPAPEGEWVHMGSVTVEEGEHVIQVKESAYFRIKTLLLETDTPLPWPQEEEEQIEEIPFWEKIIPLGIKFLIAGAVLFVIYLFRSRIWTFFGAIFRPVRNLLSRTYWQLPDGVWIIIWAVMGVVLYGAGLTGKPSGENYGFTLGGLAVILVIWHLTRVLKKRILERFPKAAEYIYRSSSTPFFAWAIALLVVAALLLVIKLGPIAEQVAVMVYYLLVVGVVGEVISLTRRKSKDESIAKAENRGQKEENGR